MGVRGLTLWPAGWAICVPHPLLKPQVMPIRRVTRSDVWRGNSQRMHPPLSPLIPWGQTTFVSTSGLQWTSIIQRLWLRSLSLSDRTNLHRIRHRAWRGLEPMNRVDVFAKQLFFRIYLSHPLQGPSEVHPLVAVSTRHCLRGGFKYQEPTSTKSNGFIWFQTFQPHLSRSY